MTKVGIIGCGNISRFHCQGYKSVGAQITRVCDLRIETANRFASDYGAQATTDYRVILSDPTVEFVSILLPSELHKEACLAAIAAGKGILCEKTLSNNASSSLEIAHAANQANSFFGVGFMKRFFPAMRQAKTLLEDMGEIISMYARTWQPFGTLWEQSLPSEYAERPSYVNRSYGGGVLVCGGSHILDLIHFFAGRPLKVSGQMRGRDGLDFDVQSNAMLWLKDGGIAHFEALWHPHTFAGYERNGWDERLEINTAKGRLDIYTVKWDHPENNGALLVHQDAQSGRVSEYRYPAINPFHLEIADVLARFNHEGKASPDVWDGYVVDQLIETITESAKSGGDVMTIPWASSENL